AAALESPAAADRWPGPAGRSESGSTDCGGVAVADRRPMAVAGGSVARCARSPTGHAGPQTQRRPAAQSRSHRKTGTRTGMEAERRALGRSETEADGVA